MRHHEREGVCVCVCTEPETTAVEVEVEAHHCASRLGFDDECRFSPTGRGCWVLDLTPFAAVKQPSSRAATECAVRCGGGGGGGLAQR
jgi:hypothetical protein